MNRCVVCVRVGGSGSGSGSEGTGAGLLAACTSKVEREKEEFSSLVIWFFAVVDFITVERQEKVVRYCSLWVGAGTVGMNE